MFLVRLFKGALGGNDDAGAGKGQGRIPNPEMTSRISVLGMKGQGKTSVIKSLMNIIEGTDTCFSTQPTKCVGYHQPKGSNFVFVDTPATYFSLHETALKAVLNGVCDGTVITEKAEPCRKPNEDLKPIFAVVVVKPNDALSSEHKAMISFLKGKIPFCVVMTHKDELPALKLLTRFDKITGTDVYHTVNTGARPNGNTMNLDRKDREELMKVIFECNLVAKEKFYDDAFVYLGDIEDGNEPKVKVTEEKIKAEYIKEFDIPEKPNVGGANILHEYSKKITEASGAMVKDLRVFKFKMVEERNPETGIRSLYFGIKRDGVKLSKAKCSGMNIVLDVEYDGQEDTIEIEILPGVVLEQQDPKSMKQNLAVAKAYSFTLKKIDGPVTWKLDGRCLDWSKWTPGSEPLNLTPFQADTDSIDSQGGFWNERNQVFAEAQKHHRSGRSRARETRFWNRVQQRTPSPP